MKELGYRLFAMMYFLFRWFPIKKNSAFLIMTHDAGPEGNVAMVASYMEKHYQTSTVCLTRKDTEFSGEEKLKSAVSFFFVKAWHMARAEYIFMDNAFLPMAYLRVRKGTKVVQLWHGTGTIKKFGQDANTGRLYEQEKRGNENIDYLIVNSEATRELYAGCFSVPLEKVKILGLPRTDLLFDKGALEERRADFFGQYPNLIGKKLVLYAPTFRDQEADEPKVYLDVDKMARDLSDEYVIGLRLHPFVASRFVMTEDYQGKVVNFSSYDNLNTLLMATDILITDYSSIIFEYCVLGRPMLFFACDLEEFSDHGRGFYRDYKEYVPGPVLETTEELIEVIKKEDYKLHKLQSFFEESYLYTDGESSKRVAEYVVNSKM